MLNKEKNNFKKDEDEINELEEEKQKKDNEENKENNEKNYDNIGEENEEESEEENEEEGEEENEEESDNESEKEQYIEEDREIIVNFIKKMEKINFNKFYGKERADRATSEQVLDPRTRMMLFKLLNRSIIKDLNGCISTGKEVFLYIISLFISLFIIKANVYHAIGYNEEEIAIKIYKTSILVFKDRDKYVSGEFRFRRGYCKSNPRKMVKLWAEKEMRNLTRFFFLHSILIFIILDFIKLEFYVQLQSYCVIIFLLCHLLVKMDCNFNYIYFYFFYYILIYRAAPKLKDIQVDVSILKKCYYQCIKMMRIMYHSCRLVHAGYISL